MNEMAKAWLREAKGGWLIIGRGGVFAAFLALTVLGLTRMAFAQSANGTNNPPASSNPVSLPNPLGTCSDLTCPLNAVIDFLYTIAIPLCAIMVLVGGFQMVTAAGDPEKFAKGRKTILYAAIGFAVIIVAGGVSTLIQNFLKP